MDESRLTRRGYLPTLAEQMADLVERLGAIDPRRLGPGG